VFYRHVLPPFSEEEYSLSASTFDLLSAFQRVLDEAPKEVEQILREEIRWKSKSAGSLTG